MPTLPPPTSTELHGKLLAFLGEELARKEGKHCIRVELAHAPPNCASDPIKTWTREEEPEFFASLQYAERLAQTIVQLCEEHTAAIGNGRQQFVLRTRQYLSGSASMRFAILPSYDSMGGQGLGEDPIVGSMAAATGAGVLALQMQNNQQMMRWTKDIIAGSIGMLTRTVDRLADENTQLRKERSDHLAELEAARSQESDREIALLKQDNSDKRKDKALGKILQLAPVVASRFVPTVKAKLGLGEGEAQPALEGAKASTLEGMIVKLLTGIDDEQQQAIETALSMEQRIMFGEMLRVAGEGGSLVLPLLVNDFVRGLGTKRIQHLMGVFRAEQRVLLMEAMAQAPQAEDEAATAGQAGS